MSPLELIIFYDATLIFHYKYKKNIATKYHYKFHAMIITMDGIIWNMWIR